MQNATVPNYYTAYSTCCFCSRHEHKKFEGHPTSDLLKLPTAYCLPVVLGVLLLVVPWTTGTIVLMIGIWVLAGRSTAVGTHVYHTIIPIVPDDFVLSILLALGVPVVVKYLYLALVIWIWKIRSLLKLRKSWENRSSVAVNCVMDRYFIQGTSTNSYMYQVQDT